jgi:hypothetical protein
MRSLVMTPMNIAGSGLGSNPCKRACGWLQGSSCAAFPPIHLPAGVGCNLHRTSSSPPLQLQLFRSSILAPHGANHSYRVYPIKMNRSPSASGLLPMPGAPSSSWALYRARLETILKSADTSVLIAFWLFGTPSLSIQPSTNPHSNSPIF